MKKVACWIVIMMGIVFLSSNKTYADVEVQGNVLPDSDYQELIKSIPEGQKKSVSLISCRQARPSGALIDTVNINQNHF